VQEGIKTDRYSSEALDKQCLKVKDGRLDDRSFVILQDERGDLFQEHLLHGCIPQKQEDQA